MTPRNSFVIEQNINTCYLMVLKIFIFEEIINKVEELSYIVKINRDVKLKNKSQIEPKQMRSIFD